MTCVRCKLLALADWVVGHPVLAGVGAVVLLAVLLGVVRR